MPAEQNAGPWHPSLPQAILMDGVVRLLLSLSGRERDTRERVVRSCVRSVARRRAGSLSPLAVTRIGRLWPSQPGHPSPARPGSAREAAVEVVNWHNVLRFVMWSFKFWGYIGQALRRPRAVLCNSCSI